MTDSDIDCYIAELLLILVYTSTSSAQLIGSRGVITLREGVEYRDPETVEASEQVANFAREFQPGFKFLAARCSIQSRAGFFRTGSIPLLGRGTSPQYIYTTYTVAQARAIQYDLYK